MEMEIQKWRDGSDKICSKCGEPIYNTQPIVGTISQALKKRHCRHFLCSPNASITIIGNGQVTVIKGKLTSGNDMAKCDGYNGLHDENKGQECSCADCNPTFGCPGCAECTGAITGCDPSEAVDGKEISASAE